MKKFILFLLTFLILQTLLEAQTMIPSQVKNVTVYRQGALIERHAKAEVKKGKNELSFDIEAFSLDENTINVFTTNKSGQLLGIKIKNLYLKDCPQQDIKTLKEKIKNLVFLL